MGPWDQPVIQGLLLTSKKTTGRTQKASLPRKPEPPPQGQGAHEAGNPRRRSDPFLCSQDKAPITSEHLRVTPTVGGPGREQVARGTCDLLLDLFPSIGCQREPRACGKFTDRRVDPDSSLTNTTQIKPYMSSAMVQTPRSYFFFPPEPSPPKVMYKIEFDTIRLYSHVNASQIGPAKSEIINLGKQAE